MRNFFCVFAVSCAVHGNCVYHLNNEIDIKKVFPTTVEEVIDLKTQAINEFESTISEIYSIIDEQRTYENTIIAFDRAFGQFHTAIAIVGALSEVVPDASLKAAVTNAKIELVSVKNNFLLSADFLLAAIQSLKEQADLSSLSQEDTYYMETLIKRLKYYGADVSDESKPLLSSHLDKIASLSSQFRSNIASKHSFILAKKEELNGLEDSFIDHLEKEREEYKLTVDYPTFFHVIKYCSNQQVRKNLFTAFNNRGEPNNHFIIKELIKERDLMARLLGYKSFAHYELSKEMAASPENVLAFLDSLSDKLSDYMTRDYEKICHLLGKDPEKKEPIGMWDVAYYIDQMKQNNYQFDSKKFKEYFPLDSVFKGLIKIYEIFFHIQMETKKIDCLWSKDLYLITLKKENNIVGHVILDIFPRKNKYSHGCCIQIIPATKDQTSLDIVIMNFPKETMATPSLLTFDAISTFFHEFGHAIHNALGRTNHYLSAGSGDLTGSFFCYLDFVELPSQLLEYWLYEEDIIQEISSHYITKEKAPMQLIRQFIESSTLTDGFAFKRQVVLSKIALYDFLEGAHKDPNDIFYSCAKNDLYPFVYPEGLHFQSSFVHIEEYGARYYGYLWSRVFACDVFKKLKAMGLNNPATGAYYIDKILNKGCSEDPNIMLKDFLGREPNLDAFLENLSK
ncbi:MAG: Zn-dependent oligopeptidase [Chlamydiales bacterium]|nr:Zn-dependent oligopeptidase [Chlamydiales bacterium]